MIQSSTLAIPYQSSFTNGSRSAVADLPIEKSGNGEGFGPHELLEAAFATCLTMTVQMYAAKHQIPLTAATSEVRIDRSLPGTAILNYSLNLEGPLTREQVTRLREAASQCPVSKTLTGKIVIKSTDA